MANSRGKRILLCVSGSIAAYKAADIVSQLVKQGHEVQCLMTESAREFVTPTVLETLSGKPAQSALFGAGVSGTEHIRLARWADVIVFAPATANLIAKLRLGMADDLVTTVALASEAPWLVAPAMNTVMWQASITQEHVQALRARGAEFIEPAEGILACGEEGAGKLATPEAIVQAALKVAGGTRARAQDLAGVKLLITAGPTTSPIDAVRYLTNHSTGKMGAALAEEALSRGAEVHYVLGTDKGVVRPTPHPKLHLAEVRTAEQMLEAALKALPRVNGVIATAAVLDYRVAKSASGKLKRASEPTALALEPSVDVLGELRKKASKNQWFLGFAAETDELEKHGLEKLRKKGLDYLFANPVARTGEKLATGFAGETNGGVLFKAKGKPVRLTLSSKRDIAHHIFNELVGL